MSCEIRLMTDHDNLYRVVIKKDNHEIYSKSGLTFQEAITEVGNSRPQSPDFSYEVKDERASK